MYASLSLLAVMNCLLNQCINLDVSPSEIERSILRSISTGHMVSIRNDLFLEAKGAGLATAGDALVMRKKTNGGKSVGEKHASDIALLVRSIKDNAAIPRTLLRNGKRSISEFAASQVRLQNTPNRTDQNQNPSQISTGLLEPPTPEPVPSTFPSFEDAADNAFRSTVVSNISSLTSSVDSLKEEVQALKGKLDRL